MEINSLNNLKKTDKLYDLYNTVIVNNKSYNIIPFECSDRHEMRIDLIAYDIYGNTNNIDILTIINNILNVFTIQKNDIIFYIEDTDINDLRSDENVTNAIKENIMKANIGKQFKSDKNREVDVNKRREIEEAKHIVPANILKTGSNFDTSNGKITLKPNF